MNDRSIGIFKCSKYCSAEYIKELFEWENNYWFSDAYREHIKTMVVYTSYRDATKEIVGELTVENIEKIDEDWKYKYNISERMRYPRPIPKDTIEKILNRNMDFTGPMCYINRDERDRIRKAGGFRFVVSSLATPI